MRHVLAACASIALSAGEAHAATLVATTTYGGNTYDLYHGTQPQTWGDAENAAEELGGHLASIHSTAENNAVYTMIEPYVGTLYITDPAGNHQGPWLGGERIGTAGPVLSQFAWSDGSAFDYANFAPGEPNNSVGNENRIQYFAQGNNPDYANGAGSVWNDVNDAGTYSDAYVVELTGAAAVPEAATWAMMLGGFGAIGAAMRTRRRTAVRFA